jgi:hypothetical protein
VGPLNDCSGVKVVIDHSDDLATAKRTITSPIKLTFDFGSQAILA